MDHIGRGWTFPPRFNRYTQTVDMATTAQEEIEQSLRVLFSTHENERLFHNDFGCSVEMGLPAEMAFMIANNAFATNNEEELTLTAQGRYLTVVMMRQFFIGVNGLRDQARAALKGEERELLFGDGTKASPACDI